MTARQLVLELRRYLKDIGPRRCPECLQDDEPHLPECPWAWILEGK